MDTKEGVVKIKHSKPSICEEDMKGVTQSLKSCFLTQGQKVDEFEVNMRHFIGMKYALAVNSGVAALHLSLLALGVKEEDEVIIPSFVCTALLNAINYVGAKPVIVDINQEDFNISFKETRRSINDKTKAIIIPHMFGCSVRIENFKGLGIPIIEDCAQAIGAIHRRQKVGSFGVISIFSFYATKMMATGYGGMALTNSEEYYQKMLDLRNLDNRDYYIPRYNYQLSDMQASLGITQLSKLPVFVKRRKAIARIYNSSFDDLDIILPYSTHNKQNIFFRFLFQTDKSIKTIIYKYERSGIEVCRPVYKPIHQYLKLNSKHYLITEHAFNTCISLPIYPALTEYEIEQIVETTKKIFR